jgi:uncharacterized protein (TIGR00297 family)
MEMLLEIAIVLLISALLSFGGWKLNLFTPLGSLAAFITGSIVGVFGCVEWFILLMVFTLAGLATTKAHYKEKVAKGLQEGQRGERTHKNVLGVGIPPCSIAVVSFFLGGDYSDILNIAFISTLAVAAADTIASEIGTRDSRVWMITTGKRVEPGINGGISVLGTISSLIASFLISLLAMVMIEQSVSILVLIPTAAGMLGNILDSIVGATLENNGHISKYGNNCITAIAGAIIGAVMYILI